MKQLNAQEQAAADRGRTQLMEAALIRARKALTHAGTFIQEGFGQRHTVLQLIATAIYSIEPALGEQPSDADPQTGIEYGDLT